MRYFCISPSIIPIIRVSIFAILQVPKDHVDEFKSIKKFKVFNTNNLWARLSAIDGLLRSNQNSFEVIANKKVGCGVVWCLQSCMVKCGQVMMFVLFLCVCVCGVCVCVCVCVCFRH